MKQCLNEEGNETVTICHQLKKLAQVCSCWQQKVRLKWSRLYFSLTFLIRDAAIPWPECMWNRCRKQEIRAYYRKHAKRNEIWNPFWSRIRPGRSGRRSSGRRCGAAAGRSASSAPDATTGAAAGSIASISLTSTEKRRSLRSTPNTAPPLCDNSLWTSENSPSRVNIHWKVALRGE